MEAAQLLDILGNKNRRKILHLLASRPCYMSEIAERLDIGAKAVLRHLELLERAGLIEANVDEQRRKYFHITNNLRLEVSMSPYSFEIETTSMALAPRQEYCAVDLKSLYGDIRSLLERRQMILQEYREVQADIIEAMRQCVEAIEKVANNSIEAEILYALLKGPMNQRSLSIQLAIPEYVLEEYLSEMQQNGIIKAEENNYTIN